MIGERYLKSSKSLSELIRYIRALAQRSKTPLLEGEDELEEQLKRPVRIAICGEDGAGKTAFIERLLDISLADVKTTSPCVSIIRNSGYRVFTKEEAACVKFYTRELQQLEVVEANGLANLSEDQNEALDHLLENADFVFWVLPSENPWAAGTWSAIESKHVAIRDKSAIILQQIDRRDPADIDSLLGHVRELSEQRLECMLPMFATSATTGQGVEECFALAKSTIDRSNALWFHVREVYQKAFELLTRTESKIDDGFRNLSGDQEYLQSIEAQIDRMRSEEVRSLMTRLSELSGLLLSNISRVMRYTALRTGVIASHFSLFGKGDTANKVELFMIDRVSVDAEELAIREAQRMRIQCRDKWKEIRPDLENRLAIDAGGFDEKSFDAQQKVFCDEMVKSTRYCMQHLKLRGYLDALITERYLAMRALLKWILVWAIAAGATGCVVENPLGRWPMLFASLCILTMLASVLYARRTGVTLNNTFEEALEDAAPALRKVMQERYIDRVKSFYHGYAPMFESMRRHVADAQADLQPQQKIAAQLFLRMKSLEQEM